MVTIFLELITSIGSGINHYIISLVYFTANSLDMAFVDPLFSNAIYMDYIMPELPFFDMLKRSMFHMFYARQICGAFAQEKSQIEVFFRQTKWRNGVVES